MIVRLRLKGQVTCYLLTCADRPVVGLTTLLLGNQYQKLGDIMVPPKCHCVARSVNGWVHVLYPSPCSGASSLISRRWDGQHRACRRQCTLLPSSNCHINEARELHNNNRKDTRNAADICKTNDFPADKQVCIPSQSGGCSTCIVMQDPYSKLHGCIRLAEHTTIGKDIKRKRSTGESSMSAILGDEDGTGNSANAK
jgi:hypothetical protein